MLENLSKRFQKILKDLKGEGSLTFKHVDAAMKEVRLALLEADVHFRVVKEFIERVRTKALGQDVMLSLSPGQQVVKIVNDELIQLLGGGVSRLNLAKVPPSVLMLVGLQGSGKTTTAGKLARMLSQQGHHPLLVSLDVYRPAARQQLSIIARELDIAVFEMPETDNPMVLCHRALEHTRNTGYDVLILDTAGRLHIDDVLMKELQEVKTSAQPVEILLVADAMTGQDAVKSATEFNNRVGLTGIILTKLDGDARGGAALSLRSVVGQPIKFAGVGEKLDALEPFFPDRLAGRILGMGDVLSLVEKASQVVEEEEALAMAEKLRRNEFTLEDFRDQLRQIRKMGPLEQVLGMLPSVGPLKGLNKLQVDEKQLEHVEAIINSMTDAERTNHQIINGQRRRRIAQGSGRPVQEVNRLLKQYVDMKKMMKSFSGGMMGRKLRGMKLPFSF
jgi:signal recognition particle subunit SRP54